MNNIQKKTNVVTERFLADFNAAWNRHDINAVMEFMAEDCSFHAAAGPESSGQSFNGYEAVRAGFTVGLQRVPDAAWLNATHFVCGDRGITECDFSGTLADGTRLEVQMVDVFTFSDGKISVKSVFCKERFPAA